MTWNPGSPVVTAHDVAEWRAWKRQRVREGQRWRRERLRRIDYQDVSAEAAAVIDREVGRFVGGDYSSVLNRIVIEWSNLREARSQACPLPE